MLLGGQSRPPRDSEVRAGSGWLESLGARTGSRCKIFVGILLGCALAACSAEQPRPETSQAAETSETSPPLKRSGGRLVTPLTAEPQTFNPVLVTDSASRTVLHRTTANLFRINRATQQVEPELVESATVSPDGRIYTLRLRPGLRFSDGQPLDADDVVFSIQVYLDPEIASPERSVLLIDGQPISVEKIDPLTLTVELPAPYAAAERMFDGIAILPQHLLADAYEAGTFTTAWGIDSPASEIVGAGPFRLASYETGRRLILERNPHYWKVDAEGRQLPYLEAIEMRRIAQEAQTLSFLAGELDVVDRLTPGDFSTLEREAPNRGYRLRDLGPGLDVQFMFFNLNELAERRLPKVSRKQTWFRELGFRRAVLTAIDLEAIVRLVFQGHATPLASHVAPGNQHWVNSSLTPPETSHESARKQLEGLGFYWDDAGNLRERDNLAVQFSLMTIASRPQTERIATVIAEDLRQLGITVQVTPLELSAVLQRLFTTYDYEACLLAVGGSTGGPNTARSMLQSSGRNHFWRLGLAAEAGWQSEIDELMASQATVLDVTQRKAMYDRVQELVAQNLPLLPLVSPNVLVGAQHGLENFHPAVLPHHTLWNAEALYWRPEAL